MKRTRVAVLASAVTVLAEEGERASQLAEERTRKKVQGVVLTLTVSLDASGLHVARVYARDAEAQTRAEATLVAFHSLRRLIGPDNLADMTPVKSEHIH